MKVALPFVNDGLERHERVFVAQIEQVRVEVEAEFAEQLASATWWERVKLRRLIRQEISRRMPKPPSAQSLYGAQH